MCTLKVMDDFGHSILETVFDSCCTQQIQIALQIAVDGLELLFSLV